MTNTKRNYQLKAVLVTGSRNWKDSQKIFDLLDDLRPHIVIHGDCATGADADAAAWVGGNAAEIAMPAQWHLFAPAALAGPFRNREAVKVLTALNACGYACSVFAFPLGESPGTRDCMRAAEQAGHHVDNHGGKVKSTPQTEMDV